jgi:predicted DsbA family dithiol-disulfide isomerase
LSYVGVVHVRYYTDPVCPWSWALEPALRRLLYTFGESLEITYVMTGMMRDPADPLKGARAALDASAASGMPVDPRLWLETPPASSYPACIAVKAAAEQGDPGRYLRRLREGFFCRRRKLDIGEALVEEARATPGLDVERFQIDIASHATLEAFGADLDRAAAVPSEHHAPGTGRVKAPSLEFGNDHGVYGFASFQGLRDAARAAGAEPATEAAPPAIADALRRFGPMAAAEIAAVCELPGPRAAAELWRLATEWFVKPEGVLSGELWTVA